MSEKPLPPIQDDMQSLSQSAPDNEPLKKRYIRRDVVFIGVLSTATLGIIYKVVDPLSSKKTVSVTDFALAAIIYFLISVFLATIVAAWGRQSKRLWTRRMLWDALWIAVAWHLPMLLWTFMWIIVLLADFMIVGIGLYFSLVIAPYKKVE